jgi:hypothetical protein
MKNLYEKIKVPGIIISIIAGLLGILDYFGKWGVNMIVFLFVKNISLLIWQNLQIELNILFVFWLSVLSFYIYYKIIKKSAEGDLVDDFKYGLGKWEFNSGDVSVNNGELIVSKCDYGILSKSGHNWRNYIFEFESKILNLCSGWIVRAKDFNNYTMIQFTKDKIRFHYRIEGKWDVAEEKTVSGIVDIKDNEWFKIRIKADGDFLTVFINDKEVFNSNVFVEHPKNKNARYISFPTGRVGFRQYGNEKACFRKVKMVSIP